MGRQLGAHERSPLFACDVMLSQRQRHKTAAGVWRAGKIPKGCEGVVVWRLDASSQDWVCCCCAVFVAGRGDRLANKLKSFGGGEAAGRGPRGEAAAGYGGAHHSQVRTKYLPIGTLWYYGSKCSPSLVLPRRV